MSDEVLDRCELRDLQASIGALSARYLALREWVHAIQWPMLPPLSTTEPERGVSTKKVLADITKVLDGLPESGARRVVVLWQDGEARLLTWEYGGVA